MHSPRPSDAPLRPPPSTPPGGDRIVPRPPPMLATCRWCGAEQSFPQDTPAETVTGWFDRHVCPPVVVRCPKCPSGVMDQVAYVDDPDKAVDAGCPELGCPYRDHLHRACSTCGYRRWERCADDPTHDDD